MCSKRNQEKKDQFFLKRILLALLILAAPVAYAQSCVTASQVTLAGNLRSSNGLPSSNYTITFQPSQQGYIAGCGVNIPQTFSCATSTDGSVVGLPNPLSASLVTTAGTGSLAPGIYYSVYAWYDAAGHITLASPETSTNLSLTGSIVVNPPASGMPSGAAGMQVYISTTPGAETLQGQTTGTGSYVQSSALVNGSTPQGSNGTLCQLTANDAVWPVGTGYVTSLTDSKGNAVPGYPMQWQLLGPGNTINLSNGLPYYHGVVQYPIPILTAPQNHGVQSITGPLNLQGYNLLNAGKVGVGTSTPGWAVDVENGQINTNLGFSIGGTAPSGHFLCGNGSVYLDSPTICNNGSGGQPYYFIDFSNSNPLTQRGGNNFLPPLFAVDNAPGNTTNISMLASGVTAGSYTNANITVDGYGRVTAVASGNAIPTIKSLIINSGICTTTGSSYGACQFSQAWGTPFADANYSLTCTPSGPILGGSGTHPVANLSVAAQTSSGFTLQLQNGTSDGASQSTVAQIDCIGIHQ